MSTYISPSWRIQAHPPLEVVFRGEAHDDVSNTFDIIRGSLSQLRSSLVLSDSDKLLYSEEDLQDPRLATGFAEIQALKLATDVHPIVPTSVVRDTARDESRFEPLEAAGIIITPEVTRFHIVYRLRSRSHAAWWRTPLTELETRKAAEELVAAQRLHPLLSRRLETWYGYESALSILNRSASSAEKADIHTELEKFASEAIEAFQTRSLESPASALQLEYERPDLSSRFAFSPPGQAPFNPLSRARAWTDPAVHQNNFPTGHVFSTSRLPPSTEARVIGYLEAHLRSDESRSSVDAVRRSRPIGTPVGQRLTADNTVHPETRTADRLSLEAVGVKRVGAKQNPEGTALTSPTDPDRDDAVSVPRSASESSVEGEHPPQRRGSPLSFAAAASVPNAEAAVSESPRASWAKLKRKS